MSYDFKNVNLFFLLSLGAVVGWFRKLLVFWCLKSLKVTTRRARVKVGYEVST